MLSKLFRKEVAILGNKMAFMLFCEPPRYIWQALRRERWHLQTRLTYSRWGLTEITLDQIFDPAGNHVYTASRSDTMQGFLTGDKLLIAEYTRTVKRLIRSEYGKKTEKKRLQVTRGSIPPL